MYRIIFNCYSKGRGMIVNKMIKDLDVVDVFVFIFNNKLNGVVGGGVWKNFWFSLRKGFYDGEVGRVICC